MNQLLALEHSRCAGTLTNISIRIPNPTLQAEACSAEDKIIHVQKVSPEQGYLGGEISLPGKFHHKTVANLVHFFFFTSKIEENCLIKSV